METPFRCVSRCSLQQLQDWISTAGTPVKPALNLLLLTFYGIIIGVVAYFFFRPLGIAVLAFCGFAVAVGLLLLVKHFAAQLGLSRIKGRLPQGAELTQELTFCPDRVEAVLQLEDGRRSTYTLPYGQVRKLIFTPDLILLCSRQALVWAAAEALEQDPEALKAFLRQQCSGAKVL